MTTEKMTDNALAEQKADSVPARMHELPRAANRPMSLVEMTAHIRKRIKAAGIKARVRQFKSCGEDVIQVNAPKYGVTFTEDEQRTIRHIAACNGLTLTRGLPIVIEQMTNPETFSFRYPR